MKKIWNILKKSILFYSIINVLLFILLYFLLKVFNITFRQWVYYLVFFLTIIGVIIGSIQIAKNGGKKTKIFFTFLGICVVIITIICWKIILLIFAFSYKPEHIITKDDKKYVAYVIAFKNVKVNYYDYINFFLVGNKIKLEEDYGKGGYDPFDEKHRDSKVQRYYYYDKNHKIINKNSKSYDDKNLNNSKTDGKTEKYSTILNNTSSKQDDIIYEKRVNDKTVIRVINKGAVLAQRSIIGIEKTTDNGETWKEQIESYDGFIQIHNGSKFVFINENIGFINDPGLAGTNGDNKGLLVTTNGGKSFSKATFENYMEGIHILDVPYLENDILKLKVYKTENNEKKYYYLCSNDNGKTWKLKN